MFETKIWLINNKWNFLLNSPSTFNIFVLNKYTQNKPDIIFHLKRTKSVIKKTPPIDSAMKVNPNFVSTSGVIWSNQGKH